MIELKIRCVNPRTNSSFAVLFLVQLFIGFFEVVVVVIVVVVVVVVVIVVVVIVVAVDPIYRRTS